MERIIAHLVSFKASTLRRFIWSKATAAAVGGDGGGGGCAISHSNRSNVIEYMLPYFFYVAVLLIIKLKDVRNRKII